MFQLEPFRGALLSLCSALLLPQCSALAETGAEGPDRTTSKIEAPDRPLPYRGINVAGAEFGTKIPGILGKDYTYPGAQEIAAYRELGFGLVRIPVRWERLTTSPGGPFRPEDLEALDRAVHAARDLDMIVVIDLHNYARWSPGQESSQAELIGDGAASVQDLTGFWTRLATRYGNDPNVWLGLMNEPNGIDVEVWWAIVREVVAGLRSGGVGSKLLVPGADWTGAHSWVSSGNAEQAARLHDPDDNIAFEVHQYLDAGSSGTSGDCQVGSAERVDAVLEWAQRSSKRLFFGELAAGPDKTCQAEYQKMIYKLEQSRLVDGWAAWGGGSWFDPEDPFSLPASARGRHMGHLRPFLNRVARNVP